MAILLTRASGFVGRNLAQALLPRPGLRWHIDLTAPTVRHRLERDRPAMDICRLRATVGWAPDTGDLLRRAERYLIWRDSAGGRALCGAKGS